jgi:hypothetical protein
MAIRRELIKKRPDPKGKRKPVPRAAILPSSAPLKTEVILKTPSGKYEVPAELIKGLSTFWYYALQNRSRWADSRAALTELSRRAQEKLSEFRLTDKLLDDLRRDGLVEISIPYVNESNWEPRILPWEFLLRAASERSDLLVVRHLQTSATPNSGAISAPVRTLFVATSPGWLKGKFVFDTEEPIVLGSLQIKVTENHQKLENPTRTQVSAAARKKPQVIHLTGIDAHQEWTLRWRKEKKKLQKGGPNPFIDKKTPDPSSNPAPTIYDGLCLAAGPSNPGIEGIDSVDASALAALLKPKDAVVACNFYYSAARVAPMMIAGGARAAIGFQDECEDAFAERFFAGFYQHWRTTGWNLGAALRRAWKQVSMAGGPKAGVVFWTRDSLLDAIRSDARSEEPQEFFHPATFPRPNYSIDVRPGEQVNYARLHNGEGLFNSFRFYKFEPQPLEGLGVEVTLYLGTDTFPYEGTFNLSADEPLLDLERRINLPLTSQFARSLRENVQTSIRVRICHGGREIYRETHRVTLLAVNDWKFNPDDGDRWLASFILPGDPAVARVVDSAQKYVMALRDDSGAGFDGYQSPEEVDLQVRALWSALAFDQGLSYINPPPGFTDKSQRLRTPSDVIDGRRGTCIDLALLFAACLEQVGLYPVIFLLWDHAFPGYWRNEESYNDFLKMKDAPETGADPQLAQADPTADPDVIRRLAFEEVHRLITKGSLVPLETVWLTSRRGFADSVQAGLDNLKSSGDFEAMVNIQQERSDGLSPLPLVSWGPSK